jgi:PAS domain S-box-containing protein
MPVKILIVEDSRTQAEALSLLLQESGYDATVAPNGEQALALMHDSAFDLVISDITMPGIDGYEVCRRIKAEAGSAQVPVLLLTSLNDPMDIVRGLAAGADNYITKPYEREHLLARIRNVLQNLELRRRAKTQMRVSVTFLGSTFTIGSEREQILDLLISSFEDAVLKNQELRQLQAELESRVQARTEDLRQTIGQLQQAEESLRQQNLELRTAERSLRESEARFRTLANSAPVLIWMSGPDRMVTYFNQGWLEFTGRTREQELGHGWQEVIHPDDLRPCLEQYDASHESRLPYTVEYRLRRRDGVYRWMIETGVPRSSADGEFLGFIGSCLDITERKEAGEALRRAHDELSALVEASPQAIVGFDGDGRVVSWYGGAERMFGWSRAEVVGQELMNIPSDRIAESQELHDRMMRGEELGGVETIRRRKDGSLIEVAISTAPLHDSAGKISGLVAVYSDLSANRRAAEEQRARQMAEAANRAKSQFLANMSHELRTPLNAIIGFSELLEDRTFGGLNDKQVRYVGNILASGRHLLQLVNDILDLAKVEAGRLTLELVAFPPAQAIGEVQQLVESLAIGKRLTVQVETPADLPELTADRSKFKQMLYNLLSNAIKFTPEGGRIRVTARVVAADPSSGADRRIQVSVADTGIGIAAEDQERIFLEFEQVGSVVSREESGTGLGLALTRRLVQLHGGAIWVESSPGVGSTFTFSLPLEPLGYRKSPAVAPAPMVDRAEGPLILVVEDDPAAGELLSHYLREHGYAVAHAVTGAQAVEMAERLRPAAITLDVLLPDQDGLEVLARLRAVADTEQIPVVVVSITDDRERGVGLGAAEWLVKPVSRDDLVAAVRRAVPPRAQARPTAVLVVDDHHETVDLLAETLERRGFLALRAYEGEAAIRLANEALPDVIVLDLIMPGMSGFEVLKRLHAQPATRDIPVLIFTFKDLTEAEQSALRGQVATIVTKSDTSELLEVLNRLPPQARRRTPKPERG